jgi:hypothetical protein
MFAKVKSTAGTEKIININQIECVWQDGKAIKIETNSTTTHVYGTIESFAKTLLDIMTTQKIMWYVYCEKE